MKEPLLIILLLASSSAYAGLNKWVDADGQVHYSDLPPPPDIAAKTLYTTSNSNIENSTNASDATASTPAAPKTVAERETELKKTQLKKKVQAEKSAQEQANTEAIKANCAAAQQNLRTFQEDIRIMEVGVNGDRSYIDDERRQQKIDKVQQDISRYCN